MGIVFHASYDKKLHGGLTERILTRFTHIDYHERVKRFTP